MSQEVKSNDSLKRQRQTSAEFAQTDVAQDTLQYAKAMYDLYAQVPEGQREYAMAIFSTLISQSRGEKLGAPSSVRPPAKTPIGARKKTGQPAGPKGKKSLPTKSEINSDPTMVGLNLNLDLAVTQVKLAKLELGKDLPHDHPLIKAVDKWKQQILAFRTQYAQQKAQASATSPSSMDPEH